MSDLEQRFCGVERLYGKQALKQFQNSHVCIIGIGGVGSWAAESLTRSGIGEITLIDMDAICITNTNRQVHTLDNSIGKRKVEAMGERCKLINPDLKINLIDDVINKETAFKYLSDDFDYIFDAIDTMYSKVALIAHCKRNKFPLITSGGAGGQIDPSLVQITDLAKVVHDPMAAKVRSELRKYYNFSKNIKRKFGVYCVYSTEHPRYPDLDAEDKIDITSKDLDSLKLDKSNEDQKKLYKQEIAKEKLAIRKISKQKKFGASTVVTASFGLTAAAHILKKLSEKQQ